MKEIGVFFKKTSVFIAVEIAIAVLVSAALIFLVIIPNFSSWNANRQMNKEEQDRLSSVEGNIATVRSLNGSEVESLTEEMEILLPAEDDILRFFSLAEVVAKASGMEISAAQADIEKAAPQVPVAPSPEASEGETPTPSTGGSGPSSAAGDTSQQAKGLSVKISFSGTYPKLLKLLGDFKKADRIALVKDLSITVDSEDTGEITASISFGLPLHTPSGTASAENPVTLTNQEIEALKKTVANVKYTAGASKGSVGKTDPFK